jgi:ribosome-associated toxin RatA of RatAB toxin-antitoxin module
MAEVEKTEIFKGDLQKVYKAISKFEEYPKYLPGVTGIKVAKSPNPKAKCLVTYELNIVKTFHYTLEMFEDAPKRIWWTMTDSNLMKVNSGSWDFEDLGDGTTKATYKLDVKFKGLVPSMITDPIAKANIPLMFSGFQKLIDETA